MKLIALVIVLLILLVSANSASGDTQNNGSGISQSSVFASAVPIDIINSGNQSTGNFTYEMTIDSLQYSTYINANWSNVEFTSEIGYPLNAWIEDNASNTSSNTSVWIHLPNIPSHGSLKILMLFLPKSDFMLSKFGPMGEAPQLSKSYGAFDDGGLVFNFYSNFNGNTLNESKWSLLSLGSGGNLSISDGFTLYQNGIILSRKMFSGNAGIIFTGYLHQPSTSGSKGGAMWIALRTMNTTLLESFPHDSNLTFQNEYGKGFGVNYNAYGYDNKTFDIESVQNLSYLYEDGLFMGAIGGGGASNSTIYIAFQVPISEASIFIQYIGEYNLSNAGMTIVFHLGNITHIYPINFFASGIGINNVWTINFDNYSYRVSTNNLTLYFENGSYNLSFSSKGFSVNPSSIVLYVDGNAENVDISFAAYEYVVSFYERGLPSGTIWSITIDNATVTSSNATIIVDLPNGTYLYYVKGWKDSGGIPFGLVSVNGKPVNMQIEFKRSNTSFIELIVISLLITSILTATFFMFVRKRRRSNER